MITLLRNFLSKEVIMDGIPHVNQILLCWITFLLLALPIRTRATFFELLIGALIARSGHITQAVLRIPSPKHWTTFYKLIEVGKWSYLLFGKQLLKLVLTFFPRSDWNLIVDDVAVVRSSKKAPGVHWVHNHTQKPNRPRCIWGQCWVALGISVSFGKRVASIPLLLHLKRTTGNASKLKSVLVLLRCVVPTLKATGTKTIRLLIDAWYMKGTLIIPLAAQGIYVIGRVRWDTALFLPPPQRRKRRGRPRTYGTKITTESVDRLHIHQRTFHIYGKRQPVRYRSIRCLARFLKGIPVIAVWMQLENQRGWSLILSTDITLTPERIIKLYARRWKIEPMFNELKHMVGLKETWQQSRQALSRWATMLCAAYALPRMIALVAPRKAELGIPPWRKNQPVTSGMVVLALQRIFLQVAVWHQIHLKYPKFNHIFGHKKVIGYQRTK